MEGKTSGSPIRRENRNRRPDVGYGDIERAAIQLLREGSRPTVEGIKAVCGGSPHTILRALPRIWARLGQMLAGDATALAGPPREVLDLSMQLWDRAREWAVHAAGQDHEHARVQLDRLRQEVELRQHAVRERERDLERQILEHQQAARQLRERLGGAMHLYERERVRSAALERRIARCEAALNAERDRARETVGPSRSRAQARSTVPRRGKRRQKPARSRSQVRRVRDRVTGRSKKRRRRR